jgi:hypothetical protein
MSAATTLDAAAGHVLASYRETRQLQDMQDALLGAPVTNPSKAYGQVVAQLESRIKVAATLKTAYAAFEALAAYDAASEFQQSASGLFDAVDSAGQAAGQNAKTDRALIARAGGAVLQWRQAERLRTASQTLRQGLTTYKGILAAASPGLVSIEKDAIRTHYAVVTDLWNRGLLQGAALISSTAPEDGLVIVGNPDSYTHQDKTADAFTIYVLTQRREQALAAVDTADAAHQLLVAQLISKHAEFEKGGSLSLAELQATADQLLKATTAISSAKGGK